MCSTLMKARAKYAAINKADATGNVVASHIRPPHGIAMHADECTTRVHMYMIHVCT